ncbi:MAG: FAD-binding oxidoreductase, partial [Actinomycetota bacterium]|nr:FAD-binding oxidoreductase [Actinomycetota bacterium]
PDLTQLFVGSEGTLGVITEVRLRVRPLPPAEGRAAYLFASFPAGLDACRRVLRRGATPAVLRLYDPIESSGHFATATGCVLIVLDEADPALVDATMALVDQECTGAERLDDGLVQRWIEGRQDVSALETVIRHGLTADTVEVAARWSALPGLYQEVVGVVGAIDGTIAVSAHQSHTYSDGACLYFTFVGHPASGGAAGAVANAADTYYRRAWDAIMSITLERGGTISHHHGIGLNRARHLTRALGPAFDVLATVKTALDPRGVLNPGKLALPSPFGKVPWP